MLRRIITFIVLITLIGAVSSLVYFNSTEAAFRLTPQYVFTLPLGVLMLIAAVAGALVMFVVAIMREGWHAVHEWRVHRGIQRAERMAEARAQARSLSLAGEYKKARALFTKATKRRQPDVGDVIDFAGTYVLEGDYAQARQILEDGQKDFGNDPLLLYALARTCRRADDSVAAISALERALAVYPNSLRILTMLRDLLFETGAWPRAAQIQERIVKIKPEDPIEHNRLLGARFEAAASADASTREADLKALLGRDPEFLPAALGQAELLENTDNLKQAIKILEKAIRHHPRSVALDALERLNGNVKPARMAKLYATLVSSQPESVALRCRAARYLTRYGMVDEAASTLDAVANIADLPEVQAVWAEIHEARSNPELAHAACRAALSSDHDSSAVFTCQICATPAKQWEHRCSQCGSWGTLESL